MHGEVRTRCASVVFASFLFIDASRPFNSSNLCKVQAPPCARRFEIHLLRPFVNQVTTMKTFSAKPLEVQRDWYVVDGSDKVLGRLAAEIALRLRGKHKPEFAPHMDNGDVIVVVNCEKIKVTGTKMAHKNYYRHSGWVGGLKTTSLGDMLASKPERVLMAAVRGMLPKNRLGRAMLKKLKIYAGPEHPHTAQNPQPLTLPY